MNKIVVKFGGSNLREAEDVRKVSRVVAAYGRPLVIVVSAFFGITNALVECVRKASSDRGPEASRGEFTKGMRELKRGIIDLVLNDPASRERVFADANARLDALERFLVGISYIGDVPDFVNDAALSYGERLSSLILTAALREAGIDAVEALPEDIGLFTNGEYGNAACDFDRSAEPVARNLRADRVFVVPGFYGAAPDGKVTLFGRGGSDYSAAAIARCIGAESLDIWKDVDGFLSADPGLVERPLRIKHLNYTEAAELSYFGAKILHPLTVEPLLDLGIPVRIMNVNRLGEGIEPCTVIDGTRSFADGVVKSVSTTDDIGILKLHGPGVGFKRGILARATATLDARGINIKSVITAQTAIDILLSLADLEPAFAALKDHGVPGVVNLSRIDGISIVAVVGDGVLDGDGRGKGIAARALNASYSGGVRVLLAQAGASEVAVYLVVKREDRTKTVRLMHAEFFE